MRYLAVIRSLGILFLGIMTYIILSWVLSWKIPGRLRKSQKQNDKNYGKRNALIEFAYFTILAFLIILGFIIIMYVVRGD